MITATYYLDLVSSWCWYAEDMWTSLQEAYPEEVRFEWKIALIPPEGFPHSREEEAFYYRRSGMVTRWQEMLSADWWEPELENYHAPNAVAEAAKDFGIHSAKVRHAITRAGLVYGKPIGHWEVAVEAACAVDLRLQPDTLLAAARSPEVLTRITESSREFDQFQINQRPGFVLTSEIGDRAVFSGLVQKAPLQATLEAMLHDVRAYRSFHAHFGSYQQAET